METSEPRGGETGALPPLPKRVPSGIRYPRSEDAWQPTASELTALADALRAL
jgi:hypothetical protein